MARLTASGVKFANGDELNSRRQIFPTGSAWIFYQTSAPTGWTKSTTHNNKALRIVSGNGGGSGGTNSFTSMMRNIGITGSFSIPTNSTGPTTLTLAQLPVHSHPNGGGSIALSSVPALYNPDGAFVGWNGGDVSRAGGWTRTSPNTGDTNPTSSRGQAHNHPYTGTTSVASQPMNIAVQYIDVIVCTFNG